MSIPIHQKIQRELRERKLRKKDLAAVLGVAPQTVTDICQGRSAVTLAHLRRLVSYFQLRADYWLDEKRSKPGPLDRLDLFGTDDLSRVEALLLETEPQLRSAASKAMQRSAARRSDAWLRHVGSLPSFVATKATH